MVGEFVEGQDDLFVRQVLRDGGGPGGVAEYQFIGFLDVFRLGVFAAAVVVLAAAAIAAGVLPARRAASVDPVDALRAE